MLYIPTRPACCNNTIDGAVHRIEESPHHHPYTCNLVSQILFSFLIRFRSQPTPSLGLGRVPATRGPSCLLGLLDPRESPSWLLGLRNSPSWLLGLQHNQCIEQELLPKVQQTRRHTKVGAVFDSRRGSQPLMVDYM